MSINPFIKIIAGLLGGSLALGAPVIPQDTGYYVRTKPATEVQFEKVPNDFSIDGLIQANIIGDACYNEFRYPDGKKEREKLDCVEYEKFGTVPNYPVPSKNGAEWMAYKTLKFDTPSGDLEEGYYSVEGTENVSLGKMLTKRVEAAISFVNASSSVQQSSVSSITWTYNNTASDNALMWLGVYMDENTDANRNATEITYNSEALTQEQENDNASDNYRTEIWRRVAPATGANTVSITFGGVQDNVASVIMTFNGVDQSSPIGDKDGTALTNSQTATTTLTTTAADSVLADIAVCSRNNAGIFSAGAGQTERFTSGSGLSGGQWGASTEAGGTSGSNVEMTWTCASTIADWAQSAVEIVAVVEVEESVEIANVHIKDGNLIIKDGNVIIKD